MKAFLWIFGILAFIGALFFLYWFGIRPAQRFSKVDAFMSLGNNSTLNTEAKAAITAFQNWVNQHYKKGFILNGQANKGTQTAWAQYGKEFSKTNVKLS